MTNQISNDGVLELKSWLVHYDSEMSCSCCDGNSKSGWFIHNKGTGEGLFLCNDCLNTMKKLYKKFCKDEDKKLVCA